MARKVDHEQRKLDIAKKAVRLFSQVGYDNVSLIMIAAACGISRTVLYRYFCSKREVLDAAIISVTDVVAKRCAHVMAGHGTNAGKLEQVCHTVVELMFKNKEFLVAVFDFVIGRVRTGGDMDSSIRTFTAGTREAIRLLIVHGKRKGEFPSVLEVNRTTDAIYAEFESCAMRIVLGTEREASAAKVRLSDVIRAISSWR